MALVRHGDDDQVRRGGLALSAAGDRRRPRRTRSATCWARSAERLPMTTWWPAAASRRARPRPCGPVPPRMPMVMGPIVVGGRSSSRPELSVRCGKDVTHDRYLNLTNAARIGFEHGGPRHRRPARLAEFYTALLGWQISGPMTTGSPSAAVRRRPDRVPAGPEPQAADLAGQRRCRSSSTSTSRVEDLPAAAAYAESIGAGRSRDPSKSDSFRVFLDPSGHPFCLVLRLMPAVEVTLDRRASGAKTSTKYSLSP